MPPLVHRRGKVSQILRNFISNALKFTERGEVRVCGRLAEDGRHGQSSRSPTPASASRPRTTSDLRGVRARSSSPLQRRVKGTGLGLPLSRKLAELLGGRVAVDSKLGVGSTFRLVVPRRYSSPRSPDAKLLVIDDEETARYIVHHMLREEPFRLIDAVDGSDAVRCLRESLPDAILLDLNMPGMSGFEVLEYLSRDGSTRDIPVIVLTSAILDEAQRVRLGHARQILSKAALNRSMLVSALTRVLPGPERVAP